MAHRKLLVPPGTEMMRDQYHFSHKPRGAPKSGAIAAGSSDSKAASRAQIAYGIARVRIATIA